VSLVDDLARLETARKNTGGGRCRVAVILDQMSSDERESLQHLLDNTEVFGTQIAGVLKENGYEISGAHIQHHRRRVKGGGCICPTPESK
jgi:hypothetical protein